MHAWIALLFFLAEPFWEAKPPEQWTDHEIDLMRISSPWTQTIGPEPNLLCWWATAEPMEEAESEARLHKRKPERQPDPDYLNYLADNRERVVVFAIGYPDLAGLSKESDAWQRVEKETYLRVGGKNYKVEGLFPPEPSDPVLRLIFPRVVKPTDKEVRLQLYAPGLPFPEREADFWVKDLTYHGKLAM